MIDVKEIQQEQMKQKARNLRYKKPLASELNYESIIGNLWNMREECGQVNIYDRDLIEDAIGDEEDADHFIMEFQMLDNDIERAIDDMSNYDFEQENYDLCLVAANADSSGYMGYDTYEEDYFQLGDYESEAAVKESVERLKRMKKDEIIEAFHFSIRLVALYETIKYRFDCLQTSIQTIKDKTTVSKQMLDELAKLYDECEASGWRWDIVRKFDNMTDALPPEVWLK